MSRIARMLHTIIWCHSTNVFSWNSITQWCNWCLGWVLVCVWEVRLCFPNARFAFSILFFFFCTRLWDQHGYCSLTVAAKFHFFHFSAQILQLTDPQISLFSNFFIENGSYGTIHTIKNYFATIFFIFSFQFSAVSKRTLNLNNIFPV